MDKKEIILCASNYYDDSEYHAHQPTNINTGFVVCGLRHSSCFGTYRAISKDNSGANETTEGFLTSLNRFVGREEAAMIAYESGQISVKKDTLYSEDLY